MQTTSVLTDEDLSALSERAHEIYGNQLQSTLEPALNGQFVAIHVDSGDHSVNRTSSGARFDLRKRHSAGMIVTTKIGPTTDDSLAYRILASQLLAGQQK